MNIDKTKIQKELDILIKRQRIFFAISMILFVVSIALLVVYIVLTNLQTIGDPISLYLSVGVNIALSGAIVLLILRSLLFSYQINIRKALLNGEVKFAEVNKDVEVIVPQENQTINVQPVPAPKSEEQQLVDQYEDLYKKGYISQEDFEQKKKDLLG